MLRRSLLLLVACALGACHVHISVPGTEPLIDRFYYPSGVLLDPDGRILYVSNGNADLRYRGGTLEMVDLVHFQCAVDAFRRTLGVAVPLDPACGVFNTAADIEVGMRQSDGTPLHGCISDPTDPNVVDCQESPFVLSNSTVRVGNFAGTMRIHRTGGAGSQTRELYLAVRGDPSITYGSIDLSQLAAAPDTSGHIDKPGLFDCFDTPADLLTRDGYDAATNTSTTAARCDSSHLIQNYTCIDTSDCKVGDNTIPTEPFNMLYEAGTHTNGEPYEHLIVSHLAAGKAMIINLLGTPYVEAVSPQFFAQNNLQQSGAFGLARLGLGDDAIYYMSSSLVPSIATFRLGTMPGGQTTISPDVTISLAGAFQSGTDGRMLITDPSQQRIFFGENAPPQLAVIDTTLNQPLTNGLPYNRIQSVVDICQEPSNMVLRQALDTNGVSVTSTIWVSCFLSNQLMLVDPDRQLVQETVLLGRGPNEMTFNFSGVETPVADALAEPAHRYAYVAEYGQFTIAVIDLDQTSPHANRVVARIGLPQPPPDYLTQH